MKYLRPIIFISILGALVYFAFFYDADRGVIDEGYMASERFQELEQKLQKERQTYLSNSQQINKILQLVIKSNDTPKLELSINAAVDELMNSDSLWSSLGDYKYSSIGKQKLDELTIYIVLVQKPGIYDEAGLLMATAQNDSLLHMQTIGEFKNTITEKVTTQIYWKAKNVIVARVTRNRLYPVEQENLSSYDYAIRETGEIQTISN